MTLHVPIVIPPLPLASPTPPPTPDYLDAFLAPLRPLLDLPDVTDLYVNQPGEVWMDRLGRPTSRFVVPDLTDDALWYLARQVARVSHQGISRAHPILSATLPAGERMQVVAPPATRGGMAIAIRKQACAAMTLADYRRSSAFAATRHSSAPADAALRGLYAAGDFAGFLGAAVKARKTILIAGGTATGKTTFANALIREIPSDERLIAIEDTPEVVFDHPNMVGLIGVRGTQGESAAGAEALLQASLRMRPSRILLGELRGAEAFTFLRAVNTGHPGSITTIHADSADLAVEQLALLVLEAGIKLDRADVAAYVRKVVDVFVQLDRSGGVHSVRSVEWPAGAGR
ncbi:P-type DNA transfer ATPase VirB11 [Microvirga sp. SRT01]|uniref:Type IV secretion system protein n=1 Tax=Sphingomonas longa TaxID=2778730 RepID=A0ABS2D2E3_9SPHN|nr:MULTISPECIES: P-type DNA transfer ATPase VirB11 [Alphaproteobacteria]MBM6575070.1 P-type DNA transfer ATPase VirB11 [Sphingomonas sp. BT552]MBR7708121.1 P-type DNA transfer ATPase VirB11 [Microvirga sp. SRT01]